MSHGTKPASRDGVWNECVVCMERTRDIVQPCGHPGCRECMRKWIERGHTTCPTCRGVMVTTGIIPVLAGRTYRIDFPRPGDHTGVTLRNCYYGVRVCKVQQRDRGFMCGLRQGDVITHINGIRVRDHATATAMIDVATEHQLPLVLSMHIRGPKFLRKWLAYGWFPSLPRVHFF